MQLGSRIRREKLKETTDGDGLEKRAERITEGKIFTRQLGWLSELFQGIYVPEQQPLV